MKLSVSLPEEDVKFLDEYAARNGFQSRSAAVQQAIRALRLGNLGEAYGEAWAEWSASDEAEDWETTVGDGI